jgi:hypothetical protein
MKHTFVKLKSIAYRGKIRYSRKHTNAKKYKT